MRSLKISNTYEGCPTLVSLLVELFSVPWSRVSCPFLVVLTPVLACDSGCYSYCDIKPCTQFALLYISVLGMEAWVPKLCRSMFQTYFLGTSGLPRSPQTAQSQAGCPFRPLCLWGGLSLPCFLQYSSICSQGCPTFPAYLRTPCCLVLFEMPDKRKHLGLKAK